MQYYAVVSQTFSYDNKKKTNGHSDADAMSGLPINSLQLDVYDELDAFKIFPIQNSSVIFEALQKNP